MRPAIRFSRWGALAAGLFLLLAATLIAWIFFVASKNPADSGESAILLLPLTMPWLMLLPPNMVGPLSGLGCIVLNSIILYCACGGLRLKKGH